MNNLTIYDANNWARRMLESGASLRECFNHVNQSPAPTIVVWDGARSHERRKLLYPEYKAQRPPMKEDLRARFDLLEALLHLTHATSIKVDGFEADDVIAQLADQWWRMNQLLPNNRVTIFSNDKDLLQILNADLPSVVFKPEGYERDSIRLFKTLKGDPSDNIPGLPGFGAKTFATMNSDVQELLKAAFEDPKDPIFPLLEPFLSNASKKWLAEPENEQLLRTFWKIIGFLNVSDRTIDQGTTLGRNAPEVADQILQGLFQ